jgi:hypothetical protein
MNLPVIGFIGLGYMGHGMAKNLLAAGYPLVVKGHRNRAAVESLVNKGAEEARSLAEVAKRCEIIHLCLSNSDQVEAVVRGPDGLLEGVRSGSIVIDCTTSYPSSTLALAGELAGRGATLVDAPLGRTPKEAEAGTLDTMVGCDEVLFERLLPVFRCWAANINRVGPTGAGHKMKLLMNFISMGYAALYSEAAVLGAKVGLPPQELRRVIGSSRLNNGFFETFMNYVCDRNRDAHKFTIANGSKDLRYLNAMAAEAGVMNVIAGPAHQYFVHAEATGHAGEYVPMLSDHVAALNGVDLADEVKKGK